MIPAVALLGALAVLASSAQAANTDQWRSRSIYQLLTDRFAPPAPNTPCTIDDRKYCGGNYRSIMSQLDYIQGMGFDAIYISPTALNLEGFTKWGEAYHGFWTVNPTKLNPHFGTGDDLKALSAALHARGMYLMVDIAINHAASTSTDISDSALASYSDGQLLFKRESDYHQPCGIKWGNHTSEQDCWMARDGVALMDLKTESPTVANVYNEWIPKYISQYGIDGMRVDATKHMTKEFQHDFCEAAGVFCIGEVAGGDTKYAASYMGEGGISSVFGFSMMYTIADVFTQGKSMSSLADQIEWVAKTYPDPSIVSTFLDNQDNARFNSRTNDRSLIHNAIVFSFMYGNIPTVYYGLEQELADGKDDPYNREALWLYNGFSRTAKASYRHIATLNKIRKGLGKADSKFYSEVATTVAQQDKDIALSRGGGVVVLTNRGAGATGQWKFKAGLGSGKRLINVLDCESQVTTDENGSITVNWKAGEPFFFVPVDVAEKQSLCQRERTTSVITTTTSAMSKTTTKVQPTTTPKSATSTTTPEPTPKPTKPTTTTITEPSTIKTIVDPTPSGTKASTTVGGGGTTTAPDSGASTPTPGPEESDPAATPTPGSTTTDCPPPPEGIPAPGGNDGGESTPEPSDTAPDAGEGTDQPPASPSPPETPVGTSTPGGTVPTYPVNSGSMTTPATYLPAESPVPGGEPATTPIGPSYSGGAPSATTSRVSGDGGNGNGNGSASSAKVRSGVEQWVTAVVAIWAVLNWL